MAEKKNVTVRMLTSGGNAEVMFHYGDERTVPADEAKRLLDSGQAEPVAKNPSTGRKSRAGANETR